MLLLLTGSLAACVLVHAIYDFGGYLVPRLGTGTIWTAPEVILTAVVGTAALVFFLAAARKLDPAIAVRLTGHEKDAENT